MSESSQKFSENVRSEISRRDLFRTAGLAAGGAMLLSLPTMLSGFVSPAEAALRKGATSMTNTTLELDGQFGGFLSNVDGGGVFADILNEPLGQDMIQRKRPGPVRFQDIVIDIPLQNVEKALSSWITETLTKNAAPKNGAIVYADINFNEVKRLEFSGALLSEIALPDADAQEGKNAALLTLRLTPQSTRLTGGKGKLASAPGTKAKLILSSTFRFKVQGLETACSRIVSVESIVVKRAVAGTPAGQEKFRQQSAAAGALNCSNVTITLPEADAGPFYAWFDDMVMKGIPGTERAGLLEWLDQSMKTVVSSVQLGGLGIVRYEPDPIKAGTQEKMGGLVQIDMYCETVNLTL
jgi:hypothetical protein